MAVLYYFIHCHYFTIIIFLLPILFKEFVAVFKKIFKSFISYTCLSVTMIFS